ncbi:unnamed protein product [Penicillium pancosmium]
MPLYHLPNELILLVAENLKSNGDLNSLIQTNTHLCKLLDPLLYLRDAASFPPQAILRAAEGGNDNTARKSLGAGLDLDSCLYSGKTLLCSAAENGHDKVLKLLLAHDKSVDPDEENPDGQTPLFCAARMGHDMVVKELLSTGRVDVNFICWGYTPLCSAAWNGYTEVVHLLLDTDGINLDYTSPNGETAIYLAAESGHESIVKLLIAAGADLGSKGHTGLSPLLGAARYGHESIVRILLATGRVNPITTNSEGESPLSLARKNCHEAIIKALELELDLATERPLDMAASHGCSQSMGTEWFDKIGGPKRGSDVMRWVQACDTQCPAAWRTTHPAASNCNLRPGHLTRTKHRERKSCAQTVCTSIDILFDSLTSTSCSLTSPGMLHPSS